MVAEFNQICNPESEDTGFFVSRLWLKGRSTNDSNGGLGLTSDHADWLLQKPRMHKPSEDDPAPDSLEYAAYVTCEHGGLSLCRGDRRRITGVVCH